MRLRTRQKTGSRRCESAANAECPVHSSFFANGWEIPGFAPRQAFLDHGSRIGSEAAMPWGSGLPSDA
jgi:hypothetical protein